MKVLLNWHESLFFLKCPLFYVFAYSILSTLFVVTPNFSILYEYRFESKEKSRRQSLGNLISQDLVCPHIFEDIAYVS